MTAQALVECWSMADQAVFGGDQWRFDLLILCCAPHRLAPMPSSKAKVVTETVSTALEYLAEGR